MTSAPIGALAAPLILALPASHLVLSMRRVQLLIATALVEVGAGFLLLFLPSVFLALLLGVDEAAPEAIFIARVAGAALLALGAACWLARKDEQGRAATGLIAAMLLYNTAIVALLAFAGIGYKFDGIVIWLAVVLHTLMAVWCLACLRGKWTDLLK